MSTIAYAALTAKREDAQPNTSSTISPGVRSYVDVFAALVPTEVLAAHAVLLSFTTTTKTVAGQSVTTITDAGTLQLVFYALLVISAGLYIGVHAKHWDRFDYLRMLIPPLAFVGWTMLQKSTAFDAVAPGVSMSARFTVAVLGAIVLSGIAGALAYQADQQQPKTAQPLPAPKSAG
jgi:hypothetical protein